MADRSFKDKDKMKKKQKAVKSFNEIPKIPSKDNML